MSWMNTIPRVLKYRCPCGAESFVHTNQSPVEDIEKVEAEEFFCPHCDQNTKRTYAGFLNTEKIGIGHMVLKEAYDKNGRLAYKVGNTYMSKAKYDYLESGKIETHYTPQYREFLEKDIVRNEHLLQIETNKKRASVIGVDNEMQRKIEKEVANLPDGEYNLSVSKD